MSPIEEYIQAAPTEQQAVLQQIYQVIKEEIPEASEKLSYGMPTFYLKENLVHFAPSKKHLGFYPTPSAVTAFQSELTDYKTSKGAIQFPYDQELPVELIKRIVQFRKQEVMDQL